jgi:hypothetical protein
MQEDELKLPRFYRAGSAKPVEIEKQRGNYTDLLPINWATQKWGFLAK